jgi:hypothetical protein
MPAEPGAPRGGQIPAVSLEHRRGARLEAIAIGDWVTWHWSAPTALNSAVKAPVSAKIWPAASSANAVIPPIAVTVTMPPLPKVVSRLPLAL